MSKGTVTTVMHVKNMQAQADRVQSYWREKGVDSARVWVEPVVMKDKNGQEYVDFRTRSFGIVKQISAA